MSQNFNRQTRSPADVLKTSTSHYAMLSGLTGQPSKAVVEADEAREQARVAVELEQAARRMGSGPVTADELTSVLK